MSILKLIPGQKIALTVAKTEQVEGNYGPQVKFSGSTPDDADAAIYLNVETATQQLGRIGYTLDSVIGHAVEIERVEKNGRKFTNINKLNGAPRAAAPAPAKQSYSAGPHIPAIDDEHPALPHEKLDHIFTVYKTCFKEAHTIARAAFGDDVADDTVAAMGATLLIAAQKAGV